VRQRGGRKVSIFVEYKKLLMAITYNPGDPTVSFPPSPTLLFEVTQECDGKKVNIVEKTDTIANRPLLGWGAPNLLIADITGAGGAADLRITTPAGGTHDVDMLLTTPSLPQSDITHTPIALDGTAIGLTATDVWPDGIYTFTFYYKEDTAAGLEYIIPTSVYILLHSQIRCCIYKMFAKLELSDCTCCSDTTSDALLAYTIYKAALYAAGCGETAKATALLALANKKCTYTKETCSTC